MASKAKCDRLSAMTRQEIPALASPRSNAAAPDARPSTLTFSLRQGVSAGLGLLAMTLLAGCATTTTLPDATPVYAEEIAPGVPPVPVERSSVNRPEPNKIEQPDAPSDKATEKDKAAGDDKAAPAEKAAPSDKSAPTEKSPAEPSSPPTVPAPTVTPPPVNVPPPQVTPPEGAPAPKTKAAAPSAPSPVGKAEVKAAPAPAPQK